MRDYRRHADSMVELSGALYMDGMVSYKNVAYGKNLVFSMQKGKVSKDLGHDIKALQLNQMKGNYSIIVADKDEIANIPAMQNVIVFPQGRRNAWNDEGDGKYICSGKLVLCVASLRKQNNNNSLCWKRHHFIALRRSKRSVIDAHNNHHGSTGYHFSFGNKGNYGMIDQSSIAQYATKKGIDDNKKLRCMIIEELIGRELRDGIERIGQILPNISAGILPVLKVANDLQTFVGDIN